MPGPLNRELLISELKIVRKSGLHRLRERIAELPELSKAAVLTMGGSGADDVERLLRHAFQSYAEGAQGTAIGILLGLEQGRRGASPAVLRKAASDRLGYYSVETFRKRPESDAVAYFADVLLQVADDAQAGEVADGTKVDRILALITDLSLSEYWELTRRVRQWFTAVSQSPM